MKLKYYIICLAGLLLVSSSCSDDLEVHLATPLDRPIIYFLLNPNDSVQYLRIQKVYLGTESALETAQNPDSLYPYGSIITVLEIEKGKVRNEYPLTPIINFPKDSGTFTSQGHLIYRMDDKVITGKTYRLSVEIPGNDKPIISETTPYSELEIGSVNRWPNGINMVNGKYAKITWNSLPNTETYQVSIRFNFFDITATDTIPNHVDWLLPRVTAPSTEGGELMYVSVPGEQWFAHLGEKIPIRDDIVKRVAGRFDYTWHFAGEPVETYMTQDQTLRNGLLSDYPQYSNIQNAIGIFSYRSSHTRKGYSISLYTLERLTTHPDTEYLNFDGRQYW